MFETQKVVININAQITTLINYNNLIISIDTTIKKNVELQRTIKIKTNFRVSIKIIVKMFMIFHDNLLIDRDFLVEL